MDILIHWDKHLHALNAHFLGKLFQKRWLGDANDFIIIITTQINTFNNDSIKHSNSFQNCVNMYISKLRKHYSQVFNEKTRNVFEVDEKCVWCVWSVPFLRCRRVLWDYWWWRHTPLPRGLGCLSAGHGEEFLVQSEHPEERALAASGRRRWHGTSRHCNRTTLWLHHWHSGPESLCPSQISLKQLQVFPNSIKRFEMFTGVQQS